MNQLYAIDSKDFSDVTDTGIGIPRRKPRLGDRKDADILRVLGAA